MQLRLPVNFNYGNTKVGWTQEELKFLLNVRKNSELKDILNKCFDVYEEVFLSDTRFSNLNVMSLRRSSVLEKDVDSFVIKFYKREVNGVVRYYIETGQFAGIINYKGFTIYISLSKKYNQTVLNHLLSYANNINIDNLPIATTFKENSSELDYLLCFLFIQKLEKASFLGFPKQFVNKHERLNIVKGNVDFSEYINKDLPFKGLISVNYRERKEVQEIIDVIYYALYLIKEKFSTQALFKIRSIYNEAQVLYSKIKPQSETIFKARKHSILNNPLYHQFKSVLDLAEIIIKNLSPDNQQSDYKEISGNLYNTAELFELYIEHILKLKLSDWKVESQRELQIYKTQFYGRKLKPDFVLHNINTDRYVVLDAKFKTMNYTYFDLDREDLFQIHTYSYYFHNNIVFSGLIYPLQSVREEIISSNILDKFNNKFGVLGIELNAESTSESIQKSELIFINQLQYLLKTK